MSQDLSAWTIPLHDSYISLTWDQMVNLMALREIDQ